MIIFLIVLYLLSAATIGCTFWHVLNQPDNTYPTLETLSAVDMGLITLLPIINTVCLLAAITVLVILITKARR